MSKSKKDIEDEKITNALYSKSKKDAAENVEGEEDNEEGEGEAISHLDPVSIRWMNKRRPKGAAGALKISAHKAAQLKEMFDGLDFDGGGEIELREFRQAINYVTETTHQEPIEPKKLAEIFRAMDTDGSGTVDFGEFLVAMTTEVTAGFRGAKGTKSAFFEFATLNKRNNVLGKISDTSAEAMPRYKNFMRLFSMEYIPPPEQELSAEEQMAKIASDSKKELGAQSKKYGAMKKNETLRARYAELMIKRGRANPKNSIDHFEEMKKSERDYFKRISIFSTEKKTFIKQTENRNSDLALLTRENSRSLLRTSNSGRTALLPPLSLKETWKERQKQYDDEESHLSSH